MGVPRVGEKSGIAIKERGGPEPPVEPKGGGGTVANNNRRDGVDGS
jgi:hypothetical protein